MAEKQRSKILQRWLDEHAALVYKVVRSYANDHHDRQDLFQEIATQLWRALPRFEGRAKETTFIYSVALFAAMAWNRKERRRKERLELAGSGAIADFIDEGRSDPRLDWLYERIRELDTVDRSLTLLMLDGFSYRDIAEMLGISEGNVGVRLTRIRKRMTKQLEENSSNEF